MTTELTYLGMTAGATSLMWMPYILNAMLVRGVWVTLDNPREDASPLSPWADRARRAHYNAVENLVVFAALALAASAAGVSNEVTVNASIAYLWVRLGHYFVYMAGIPVVRTLLFLAGFGCQVAMATQILF